MAGQWRPRRRRRPPLAIDLVLLLVLLLPPLLPVALAGGERPAKQAAEQGAAGGGLTLDDIAKGVKAVQEAKALADGAVNWLGSATTVRPGEVGSGNVTAAHAAAAAVASELDALVEQISVQDTLTAVQDPEHRPAVAVAFMLVGLLLAAAGYRLLSFCTGTPPLLRSGVGEADRHRQVAPRAAGCVSTGLFLVGFVAAGLTFFTFSPSIFHLGVCCGPGTELGTPCTSGARRRGTRADGGRCAHRMRC